MERSLNLTVALTVCLLLTGCAGGGVQDKVDLAAVGPQYQEQLAAPDAIMYDAIENDYAQPQNQAATQDEMRVSATVSERKKTYTDEKTQTVLLQTQIQYTTVSVPDVPEIEENLACALSRQQSAAEKEAASFLQNAETDFAAYRAGEFDYSGDFYGYSYYTFDTINRLDTDVFSLSTYYSTYLGGAHPSNWQKSVCFNMETGEQLSLYDVLLPAGREQLENMVLEWLYQRSEEYRLFYDEECVSVVEQKFGSSALKEQLTDWYLTSDSLVVFFNPCEISPYAAGIIKIAFTAQELKGLIRPEFLETRENEVGDASVAVCLNGELDGSFATAEHITASEGDCFLEISGYGVVNDLSLLRISWIGQQHVEQCVLYTTNYLSSDNLITVELASEEELKNLCLQLVSSDGTVRYIYFNKIMRDEEIYVLQFE